MFAIANVQKESAESARRTASKKKGHARCAREHPDMMSASEGGGGSWKSGHSKGGCVNFTV